MKILIGGTGKMGSLIKDTAQAGGNIVTGMVDAFDLSPLDTMEILVQNGTDEYYEEE